MSLTRRCIVTYASGESRFSLPYHLLQQLNSRTLQINGKEKSFRYFSDDRDVAYGVSMDGMAPFKRRKNTCWPILVFDYNLPPEIRFLKDYVLCLGEVPGPKKPYYFDSFLYPFIQEALKLEIGIAAYDCLTDETFTLRGYLLYVFGDMPAMSMAMRMLGTNAIFPCRACHIRGIRVPGAKKSTTHYVPLDRTQHPAIPDNPDLVPKYDPLQLPKRTHDEFMAQAQYVHAAPYPAEEKRRSKACGIKGVPILSQLSSISFPDSFPLDFMHLIWENLLDNLMDLWTSPDSKDEDYHLLAKVWKAIWQSSKDSNATMPSAYGPSMPNTPPDAIPWTSSLRAFWTLFFGPSLLRRRFKHERYYKHFVDLVKLLNICLQFEITRAEIVVVRKGFAKWVVDYERCILSSCSCALSHLAYLLFYRIYYKHDPARLALCPSTLHALLHIADYIEATGPVWCTWAFPMERFCSSIQPAIKSRRFPYASIDSWLVDSAHLMIIKLRFGLSDELSLLPKRIDQGICIPGCRCFALPVCCSVANVLFRSYLCILPTFEQDSYHRAWCHEQACRCPVDSLLEAGRSDPILHHGADTRTWYSKDYNRWCGYPPRIRNRKPWARPSRRYVRESEGSAVVVWPALLLMAL
jgi:hypothetical protein